MVQRYTTMAGSMADDDGHFVLYEDYEALAAECAALKDLARGWANATDDRLFEEHGEIFHDSIEDCEAELKAICPATDRFLAEQRAIGVEMVLELIAHTKDMLYADSVEATLSDYAAQLRNEVKS